MRTLLWCLLAGVASCLSVGRGVPHSVFELELELCQVHSRSQGSSAVRQSELERVHHRGRALALRGGAVQMSLGGISAGYATALAARPVLTKSLTSGAIFALSDVAGQSIAPSPQGLDLQRTVTNLLVGLCCFGPALHYWLELITGLIPGVGVVPTLLKTLMGQTIFGPTITGVFFAAALVSNHGLVAGLKRWPLKVKQDLLKTWTTGLCFWPFVDLACYGLVLPYLGAKWISLSYNMASFFWTIFLSLQAARQVGDDS